MLYHATFRRNIQGIKELGLMSVKDKYWKDSLDGIVCLATDEYAAESYCEVAMDMSDDETLWEEDIIVLGVKEENLDLTNNKLINDPHMILEENQEPTTYAYTGTIPANELYVFVCKNLKTICVGKLMELTDIPKFSS